MAINLGGENGHGGMFSTINITPLTDIFLVLLIIFMVATAVSIESAAHVDLPKLQAPTSSQQPKTVTITYNADHQIFVNDKPVTRSELAAALTDALKQVPDKVVVFNGDPRVILGDMVTILDVAKGAGADKIALAINSSGEAAATNPAAAPEPVAPTDTEPAPESVAPSAGGMP